MIFFVLGRILAVLVDLIAVVRRSDQEKDHEIVLLRQQLRILQRTQPHPPRLSHWERLPLAVLAAKRGALNSHGRHRLNQAVLLFKPDILVTWHGELVRRTWTFSRQRTAGRPPSAPELAALILRLANENPCWGYSRLHGALLKPGYTIGRSTVRAILKRCHVPPGPQRTRCGSR